MNTDTALMIIDVQLGMFDERFPVVNGEALLGTVKKLLERARAAGTPVIFIQHNGQGEDPLRPDLPGWAIHPAIQPLPGETVLQKDHPDAFQDTRLQTVLQGLGVKNLVAAGIQTEFCVDTTCRRAYSLGYTVTLAQDGHSTWDSEALTAAQIIAHHNLTLGGWFVKLLPAEEIHFG